jgi:hypothetical protein
MLSVRVRLPKGEVMARIDELRTWLIDCRFELLQFKYRIEKDGAIVEVWFSDHHQAEAFADAFQGMLAAI